MLPNMVYGTRPHTINEDLKSIFERVLLLSLKFFFRNRLTHPLMFLPLSLLLHDHYLSLIPPLPSNRMSQKCRDLWIWKQNSTTTTVLGVHVPFWKQGHCRGRGTHAGAGGYFLKEPQPMGGPTVEQEKGVRRKEWQRGAVVDWPQPPFPPYKLPWDEDR